ncbi:HAD-IIB family hydrolase [Mangrovibacillus sp. Mu-81]|jgi:HAD superfamily hydrolase (TIGR01484 family)|uniref:HAD-IIB family hydrolase n=1 Tax=Mangrovibacillus sp. Mu-81 TaxID=3121478 RepID=UPI002FE4AD68
MIFVFDLDGTICFKGQPLNFEICEALDVCLQHGHEIIFASARPIRDLLPVLPKKYRQFRMVGGNGAFTYNDEKISVHTFALEMVEEIIQIIEEYKLTYLIDSDWNYSYTGDVQHPIYRNLDPEKRATNMELGQLKKITKCLLFTADDLIKKKLECLHLEVCEHGQEGLLDISPLGIHKMEGLRRLGILPGEFVAFGNDQNDLELFKNAKYSVCVGDHPIKSHANLVVEIEGVSTAIRKMSDSYKNCFVNS